MNMRAEIEQHFSEDLVGNWFPRCIDPEGGFHQSFLRDWSRGPTTPRFIVFQSRMTWLAGKLRDRLPGVADHGVRYLAENFVASDGTPLWTIGGDRPSHAYGAAFAIFACASADSQEALELAERVFGWMDRELHDPVHGGYFELLERNRQGTGADVIGTPYGMKSQNSHLHILEAFAELAPVWPSPLLRERLREVMDIVAGPLMTPDGALNCTAHADWSPGPGPISYGHNIEAAHLLLAASTALSVEPPAAVVNLINYTIEHAVDWENGGIFNTPDDHQKIWWVQAEALLGLASGLGLPGVDPRCAEALESTWSWIRDRQVDPEFGGWFDTLTVDGRLIGDGKKAHMWKAAYHDGRALLYTPKLLQ